MAAILHDGLRTFMITCHDHSYSPGRRNSFLMVETRCGRCVAVLEAEVIVERGESRMIDCKVEYRLEVV